MGSGPAVVAVAGLLLGSTLLAEEASMWSKPTMVAGPKKYDQTLVWTLPSVEEATTTLEVRCIVRDQAVQGEYYAAEVILVTGDSLLKMADDDGEIDIAFSFDGGKLEEHSTHIIKGYHGLTVSRAAKDVKRFLKNDGKPYLIRVSGHGSQAVYNFALTGAAPAKLGGICVQ